MVKTATYRTLGFTFSAFSLISAAAQTMTLDQTIRYLTFATTVLLGIAAFFIFKRLRAHDRAINALSDALTRHDFGGSFQVRNIANEAELRELWHTDKESYGNVSLSFEHFLKWWQQFPPGLFAIFDDQTIVGGFGIWPLTRSTFIDFIRGNKRERDISARGILKPQAFKSKRFWYISGLVLTAQFRKTKAITELLACALRDWRPYIAGNLTLSICSMAYSKDGEAMLRRFGFRKYLDASETPDKHSIYVMLDMRLDDFLNVLCRILPDLKTALEPSNNENNRTKKSTFKRKRKISTPKSESHYDSQKSH